VEFTVLRDVGQAKNKVRTLNFRKANFQLFKELVNRTPWESALRDKEAEQGWQTGNNGQGEGRGIQYFFASVFTGNLSFHTSQVDGSQYSDWGSKVPPTTREDI